MKLYQIDAFTDRLFAGNPAAVCPLEAWLSDEVLQAIAAENNLSETAFYVPEGEGFRIRWFTPKAEVDLCGHATLATGHVLFQHEGYRAEVIVFSSRSGTLTVHRAGDFLVLDFPVDEYAEIPPPESLIEGLGRWPAETYHGRDDFMLVYDSAGDISSLRPDFGKILEVSARGVIVTAPGEDVDFVSRFFAPTVGINEDPVTGSSHTTLTPYWAKRLHKTELTARQLSARGGFLKCALKGDRVHIAGQAVTYLVGEVEGR